METLDFVTIMHTSASRIEKLMSDDKITTQQELADILGYDTSSISKYLNPEKKPSPKFLEKLEDKFGWSARWIRTGLGAERVSKPTNTQTGGSGNTVNTINSKRINTTFGEEKTDSLEVQFALLKMKVELLQVNESNYLEVKEKLLSLIDSISKQ